MMRLPATADEVTSEWVQEALSERWPGIRVHSVALDDFSHGSATRARTTIDFTWKGSEAPPPNTMWLKTGFEPKEHHQFVMPVYAAEIDFYRYILPQLPIRSPDCYFAGLDDDPPQATLLLEDLTKRHVQFCTPLKPLTLDQVASGLEQLAALHSYPLDNLKTANASGRAMLRPIEEHCYHGTVERGTKPERYFDWPRAYASPVVLLDADRIRAGYEAYWKMNQRGQRTVVHGDAHVGNSYMDPDGTVTFLDWQGVGTGYWMHDVPYYLIGALDLPERRKGERDLFKYYLDKRREYGSPVPEFEQIWEDYRRAVYWGFMTWIGNEDTWQPMHVNVAQYARFAVAMIDHDTFDALGV